MIIGNTTFYGAIRGEAYIRGRAGERFCIRNSGLYGVVEGTGDHGCEYMTGGTVVVLGQTGRNFGAGMSGGTAYLLDADPLRVSTRDVSLEPLDGRDTALLRALIERHRVETGSAVATRLLADWDASLARFTKVMPHEYKRALEAVRRAETEGTDVNEAVMAAAHG